MKSSTCECDQGYFSQNGFCKRQLFYASLTLILVYLEFTDASGVASETNSILDDKVLQVQLYEYDPSAEEAKQL